MAEFRMPSLGADMVSGRLVEWHRRPGDAVRRGDIIADVDTDKGVIEVEVFTDGVVEKLLVQPGETVAVGTILATITEAGGGPPPEAGPKPTPEGEARQPSISAPPHPPDGARASPRAQRRAHELQVDLGAVAGTGPEGTITTADVEAAAAKPPAEGTPADRMRQAIAAAMARSKREIPHYYLSHTADIEQALAWLEEQNAERAAKDRVLPIALLVKAVAQCLREYPELNAWYERDIIVKQEIHIGIAIALKGGGLVAPALHDADQLGLSEISARVVDLVNRARRGRLRSSEVSDPTITVTSLGDRGVDAVFGVIYPPQVAIVGFGTPTARPWVTTEGLAVRRVVNITLAADHRVSDGHRGGLFLAAVAHRLLQPEEL